MLRRLLYHSCMVKRASQTAKPEKVQTFRRRMTRPKVKMEQLRDVVVDGKLMAQVGDKVYFERIAPRGKMTLHEGIIKGVTEKGLVEIWDETVEQFYSFSLHQSIPVIKMV